jgi:transposase
MEVTYSHCAGLDVHKRTVVACCLTPGPHGAPRSEIRTFGTMTADLLALSDWLTGNAITHVAMESTGEFWKPVYNLLEGAFTVLVVNAQHIKNVPGRKTDVKDAQWIADLLRHGLVRGSFIPPLPQRDLRDLTRQRTNLVQERATVTRRLQKVLEWANVKLAAVATDVTGVSARRMLTAIIAGEGDGAELADLAKGRLRSKRAELERALTGRVRDHHRFLLAQHLTHLDFLEEQLALFDTQIAAHLRAAGPAAATAPSAVGEGTEGEPLAWEEAVALLDTIPGVGRAVAELIIAEIGTDMRRFPSSAHLASWAKLCPGNHERAGKRSSGATGHGNRWLRSGLVQAAHAAVKVKGTTLAAAYRRLVARRGVKKAIIAIAHRLVTAIYYLLLRHEPYREPSPSIVDARRKAVQVHRMQRRIEQLGFEVILQPLAAPAA